MGYAILSDTHYIRWYDGDETGIREEYSPFILALLRHAGYERILFWDRDTPLTPQEFWKWLTARDKCVYIGFRSDGTPIFMTWLSDPSATGCQAYAHFTTLGTAPPKECMAAGKDIIRWWGRNTKLEQLIGITPVCYRHAWEFAYGLGFKKLTVLRKIVKVFGKERNAILSICDIREV